MCRTIACVMKMTGHGKEIRSMEDLLAMLAQFSTGKKAPETHEEFIKEAILDQEMNIRISEAVLKILKSDPPEEGAKLVGLEGAKPVDAEKHGFATIATYELQAGAFLVVGTDHLTQEIVSHTVPNSHGLQGMIESVQQELAKRSIAAADAKDATEKASQPESQEADSQGTATS